jgi:hypothetical protein
MTVAKEMEKGERPSLKGGIWSGEVASRNICCTHVHVHSHPKAASGCFQVAWEGEVEVEVEVEW